MIFLLSNNHVNGDLSVDSYFINPRYLKHAYLIINGQTFPSDKLSFCMQVEILRSYNFFMKNMGLNVLINESIGISHIEYVNHSFALAFDLTPDSCMNDHLNNSKDCMTDIKLIFNNLLKKAYNSVIYYNL